MNCRLCFTAKRGRSKFFEIAANIHRVVQEIFSQVVFENDENFLVCQSCNSHVLEISKFYTEIMKTQEERGKILRKIEMIKIEEPTVNVEDDDEETMTGFENGIKEEGDEDETSEPQAINHNKEPEVSKENEKPEADENLMRRTDDESDTSQPKEDRAKLKLKRHREEKLENVKRIKLVFGLNCEQCKDVQIETLAEYKSHMETEHDAKEIIFECCSLKFNINGKSRMLDHARYHENPECFSCIDCNEAFNNRSQFNHHKILKHSAPIGERYTCSKCKKICIGKSQLEIHLLKHLSKEEKEAQRNLPCVMCGKKFFHKILLENHVRQAHSIKPKKKIFVCEICAKKFTDKANFTYHVKQGHLPADEVPMMRCKVCEKSLRKSSLASHMRNLHGSEAGLVKECPMCGQSFLTTRSLSAHISYKHKKTKSFQCESCEKAFKSVTALREHVATHTGIPLYVCSFCDKSFNSRANMYSHRKRTHPKEHAELRTVNK